MDPKVVFRANVKTNPYVSGVYLLTLIVGITIYGLSKFSVLLSIPIFFALFWLGHGIGQHRYLSHNLLVLNRFWHTVIILLATLVSYGSPLGWAMLHKAHHRYNGTSKDSYLTKNPLKIFFCITNPLSVDTADGRHLNDSWVVFTHRYYHLILIINNITLYIINPEIWIAFNLAVILCYFAFIWTWAVAHQKHFFSYQNFKDDSFNDLFCGYILGEWHNNHHNNPKVLNEQVKWWEIDVLYLISKGIRKNV